RPPAFCPRWTGPSRPPPATRRGRPTAGRTDTETAPCSSAAAPAKSTRRHPDWGCVEASSLVLPLDANQQHPAPELRRDPGRRDRFRQGYRALKSAIRDFHAIVAASFVDRAIAPHAADRQVRPVEGQFDILGQNACQIELDEPAG